MELFTDWGGKLVGATVRIAAVLHCVEFGPAGQVGLQTVAAAIAIARYLIPHAETALSLMEAKEDSGDEDAAYVLRWILRHERFEFTKRDAQQHGKRRFPKTELIKKHTLPTVTEWLGNTPKIAMRHYLMSTKEEFEAAVRGDQANAEVVPKSKMTQKTAQQAHAGCRGDSHSSNTAHEKTPGLLGFASGCDLPQLPGLAGTGFEPATSRL
jgi:hypothetical protein